MNGDCASYPKVSLSLGFKNPTKEDSYLKSATPKNALLTDIARRGIPQAQFINLLSDKSGIDG
jgi:hypothetical protein